ncbi:uncharacterized protein LOC135030174 [Pseudophryne corroboree]|uniref:uncharacterized protein LOC135030174 n=1 Tax=Pseudophryne corroboree TaxID=495146 RepID=UPI0030815279
MCPGQVPSLLCLLTVTSAVGALYIFAAQSQVTGCENGSTMLAVSYKICKEIQWLQIRWELVIDTKPVQLVICTIQPLNSSKKELDFRIYPPNGFEKRMTIIPHNGSLKIEHLKVTDSGTYKVSVLDSNLTVYTNINLTVSSFINVPKNCVQSEGHEQEKQEEEEEEEEEKGPVTEGHCICPSYNSSIDVATSAWIFLSSRLSSTFLILLVLFGLQVKNRKQQRHRKVKMLPPNRYRR